MNPEWILDQVSDSYENALRSIFIVLSGSTDVTYGLSSYTDIHEFFIGFAGNIKVSVNKVQNTLTADISGFTVQPGFMEAAKLVLINNLKLESYQPADIDIEDKKSRYVVRLSYKSNIEESGTMTLDNALDMLEDLSCFEQGNEILRTGSLTTTNSFKKSISVSHPRSQRLSVGYVMIIKLEEPKQVKEAIEEVVVSGTTAVQIGDVICDLKAIVTDPTFDDAEVKTDKKPPAKRRPRTTAKNK